MFRSNPVEPRGRPLIAVGYNYNVRKVISLIVIEVAGSTKPVLTYLSKYPDQFYVFHFPFCLSPCHV